MPTWPNTVWGGLNVRDQAGALTARSHAPTAEGFSQRAPVESPHLFNIEFTENGIRKRRGSAAGEDFSAILQSSETILRAKAWRNPSTNQQIQIAVGTKSIYVREGTADWKQINDSASAAYTHAATASLADIVFTDGHAVIGIDGANQMQLYRSGDDLDADLDNGQTYEHAYGGTDTMTGTWADAAYLMAVLHTRLVYTDGNTQVEYTPMARAATSGVYDLGGSTAGSHFFDGAVRMLAVFSPDSSGAEDSLLYVATWSGLHVVTGFLSQDRTREHVTHEAPLNHQAWCSAKNWLIYLTRNRNLLAVNGTRVIDLGARLRATEKDGPLDDLSVADSEANAFCTYCPEQEMVLVGFSSGSGRTNDRMVAIDLKLGEPVPGEPPESFERRVRLLDWRMLNPDDNAWFVDVYVREGEVVGITSDAKTYTLFSGNDDQDTVPILGRYRLPVFTGGDSQVANIAQWLRLVLNCMATGDWDLTVRVYTDRAEASTLEYTVNQVDEDAFILDESELGDVLGGDAMVRDITRLLRRSETIQIEFENGGLGEYFIIPSAVLSYEPAAIVR